MKKSESFSDLNGKKECYYQQSLWLKAVRVLDCSKSFITEYILLSLVLI